MDKACTEVKYVNTYARLCDYLIKDKSVIKDIPEDLSEEERSRITFKNNVMEVV